MSEESNIAAFNRIIDGYNHNDPTVVDEVCAADYVDHEHGLRSPDREGLKATFALLPRFAPDTVMTVEEISAVGNLVWGRVVARGTHTGGGLGSPTRRKFEFTIMDLCRFEDGRMVEHWGVSDRFALFTQLGLLSAAGVGRPAAED